jgi:hypothetical protein
LEQKLPTGTYLGLNGEILNSKVQRIQGAFVAMPLIGIPTGFRENLDFEERSLTFTLNQLIGDGFSVGARYRLTDAKLNDDFVDVPSTIPVENFQPRRNLESLLHQLSLDAIYNHPCGVFAQFQALWNRQSNDGFVPDEPGDNFWQFNAFVGYRFPRRRVEMELGLLNLTDRDYRLEPLTLYQELPRQRTLVVRLQLNF